MYFKITTVEKLRGSNTEKSNVLEIILFNLIWSLYILYVAYTNVSIMLWRNFKSKLRETFLRPRVDFCAWLRNQFEGGWHPLAQMWRRKGVFGPPHCCLCLASGSAEHPLLGDEQLTEVLKQCCCLWQEFYELCKTWAPEPELWAFLIFTQTWSWDIIWRMLGVIWKAVYLLSWT